MSDEERIQALRDALAQGMRDSDIEHVVPVIVPCSYIDSGKWIGPHDALKSTALALVWAVLHPGEAMVYVTRERAALWVESSVDWKLRALDNLRRLSSGQLFTGAKVEQATKQLAIAVMMHADGLGSSRLLLADEIAATIGSPSYSIGFPDRSCALVIPDSASHEAKEVAAKLVRDMFRGATVPMLPELLRPEDFVVVAARQ
jgi:hypothetical protein